MNKTARVMTNDPKQPQMMIGLQGTIWVPIEVSPRYGHLKGVVGDTVQTTVQLEAKKEEPLTLELGSVTIADKIDVSVQEVEKGRRYQIQIKNKEKGVAAYTGEIQLKTNYPEMPELSIRVTGNVRPAVEVRPSTLNFGRVSQEQIDRLKQSNRPLTRPVMVILNRGSNLEVSQVRMEQSLFKAKSTAMGNGRMVQVVLEADWEKLKKGRNEDLLEIRTNQAGHEVLKVPVLFELL